MPIGASEPIASSIVETLITRGRNSLLQKKRLQKQPQHAFNRVMDTLHLNLHSFFLPHGVQNQVGEPVSTRLLQNRNPESHPPTKMNLVLPMSQKGSKHPRGLFKNACDKLYLNQEEERLWSERNHRFEKQQQDWEDEAARLQRRQEKSSGVMKTYVEVINANKTLAYDDQGTFLFQKQEKQAGESFLRRDAGVDTIQLQYCSSLRAEKVAKNGLVIEVRNAKHHSLHPKQRSKSDRRDMDDFIFNNNGQRQYSTMDRNQVKPGCTLKEVNREPICVPHRSHRQQRKQSSFRSYTISHCLEVAQESPSRLVADISKGRQGLGSATGRRLKTATTRASKCRTGTIRVSSRME